MPDRPTLILEQRKLSDVPEDAIILDNSVVISKIWQDMFRRKKEPETWPFVFGAPFLAVGSLLTNGMCLWYYRGRLNVGRYGRNLSYVTCAGIPAVTTALLQHAVVSNTILEKNSCEMCSQAKSMLIQSLTSIGYGVTLAPWFTFYMAYANATYFIPGFETKQDLRDLYKLWLKLTSKIYTRLRIFWFFNLLACTCVTVSQYKTLDRVYETALSSPHVLREFIRENAKQ